MGVGSGVASRVSRQKDPTRLGPGRSETQAEGNPGRASSPDRPGLGRQPAADSALTLSSRTDCSVTRSSESRAEAVRGERGPALSRTCPDLPERPDSLPARPPPKPPLPGHSAEGARPGPRCSRSSPHQHRLRLLLRLESWRTDMIVMAVMPARVRLRQEDR